MLIVFSGLDGAGKSTQINLLLAALQKEGQPTRYLWTRGGYTPRINQLKVWLRRLSGGKAVPQAGPSQKRTQAFGRPLVRRLWLVLAILDLVYTYACQIRYWQLLGNVVVCDRYWEDTLLDFRQNFPQEAVERWWLWRFLRSLTPRPTLAILLLVPVAESLRRSAQKNEPFPDSPAVLAWRLAAYEQMAQQDQQWLVLDGRDPVEQVARQIYVAYSSQRRRPMARTAS